MYHLKDNDVRMEQYALSIHILIPALQLVVLTDCSELKRKTVFIVTKRSELFPQKNMFLAHLSTKCFG